MPPKNNLSKQRESSRRVSSEHLPIYEILATQEIREPLLDIMPEIQRALKEDPLSLKVNLLNFLLRLCGLEGYDVDNDAENTINALEEVIEKAYELKSAEINPLIIQQKNKFHKDFVRRVKQFIRALISDEVGVFNDQKVQFNQSFLSWLQILTNTKLRAIRNASIQFTRILLEEEIALYENYRESRQSKKAFMISKSIGYFSQKLVSPRFIDIDQSIRVTAFDTTYVVLLQLEGDLMSEQLLHKMFTPLFDERVEVITLFLNQVQALLQSSKNTKVLAEYLKQHLNRLVELSRNAQHPHTNMKALRIIERLHHQQPALKLLNRDYLVSLVQVYAPATLFYALIHIVEVFYNSLYKTVEELEFNSPIVLLQIINLLMGVSSKKNLALFLNFCFQSRKVSPFKVFNIDNLFNLLLSQSYRDERNVDVQLKDKEVSILISIMIEWVKNCAQSYKHAIKDKPIYQKVLQSFNSHILVNCKQLFFQKMTKHQDIAQKYMALFSQIHCPALVFGQIENYLDFVCEKAQKLFEKEVENTKVYRQIVKLLQNIGNEEKLMSKYSAKSLIAKIPLLELTREQGQITTIDVYRLSALFSKFPISQLAMSQNFMHNLIQAFANSASDLQKIEMINIFHFVHHYDFSQLIHNPSQSQLAVYKTIRDNVIRMYVSIMANSAECVPVKLSAFRALVYLLKAISSKRFEENILSERGNAYELNSEDMRIVYEFITRQLFDSDSLDYSSIDLTKMLDKMTLDTQQVRTDILRFLFDLYEESYVFTCHPESVKFIITMIKAQFELHREVSSKSHSLLMSLDLTKKVENRLNSLLETYYNEELKQSNNNKLIYWRLCFQIFTHSRNDEKFQVILDKLLSAYFGKKKNDPVLKKKATNKIMIFILQAVDIVLERQEYIQLDIYQNLFRKIARKIPKQTLIRVKEFLIEKTQGIQSNYVKNFLETLDSIAKVQIKKSKKRNEQDESQSEQSGNDQNIRSENVESDDEERQRAGQKGANKKSQRGKKKSKRPQVRMSDVELGEESEEDQQEMVPGRRKGLRSETKKKIK